MTETIDLKLRSGPTAPREARRALDRISQALGAGLLQDLRLLISELVTNSYRHATRARGQSIRLRIEVRADTIRVEVCDNGVGFDPNSLPPRGLTSGWGLVLVRRIADRWGVSGGGPCCVWFEMDGAQGGSETSFADESA
jgi:anti-sigma regulatory factor (Ser/Thr protein kinase)